MLDHFGQPADTSRDHRDLAVGGRIGTNLLELGTLSLEELAAWRREQGF